MMQTTRPKAKSGFYIGVSCPACGGELELEENFFVLTCSHCGSALRIVRPNIPPAYLIRSKIPRTEVRFHLDHYLKENKLPLSDSGLEINALYYPYWKIDAIVLKLRNRVEERQVVEEDSYNSYGGCQSETIVKQRKTDIALAPFMTTLAAGEPRDDIPYSIGMRAEYIKMEPFSREHLEENFECFPVLKSWSQVETALSKDIAILGNINQADFGRNKTELFNTIDALIYFPYFLIDISRSGNLHRIIIDGITGRVLNDGVHYEMPEESKLPETTPIELGKLGVELHRCNNCGLDLPTEQAYVYICHNCHQLVQLERHALLKSEISAVAPVSAAKDERYFPFWRLRLPEGSARKLQILFGGIYQSDFLVVPAFKSANFEAMYRLAKRISAASAKINSIPIEEFEDNYAAVTVGPSEALAMAEIIIYRERLSKNNSALFQRNEFSPSEISLFFAPFHPENYFYVDSAMNAVTFEKRMVEN